LQSFSVGAVMGMHVHLYTLLQACAPISLWSLSAVSWFALYYW